MSTTATAPSALLQSLKVTAAKKSIGNNPQAHRRMNAVEIATAADLMPTLELIKQAVEAGELDAQMEAAALKLREGFVK